MLELSSYSKFSKEIKFTQNDVPFSKLQRTVSNHFVTFLKMTFASSPSSTNLSSNQDGEACPFLYDSVWRKTYQEEDTLAILICVTIVNLIAVVPTIGLNALVILAVATRQRLRTKSNVLLACLAGADLLPGLVVYPIAIAVEMKRILGIGPFCTLEKLYAVGSFAAGFTSFSHLVLISIDRCVAIKHSLRYEEIVSTQRIQRGVLLAWAITVCLTIQDLVSAFTESDSKLYDLSDRNLCNFGSYRLCLHCRYFLH